MSLKLRHPVIENQYCTFNVNSVAVLPVPAGTIVTAIGMTSDNRTIVDVISDASVQEAFGFLMQPIKDASCLPPNAMFASELGSTSAHLGDAVGVAHGSGAVYETSQYQDVAGSGIVAGAVLFVSDAGLLADSNVDGGPKAAIAMQSLSIADAAAGLSLRVRAIL